MKRLFSFQYEANKRHQPWNGKDKIHLILKKNACFARSSKPCFCINVLAANSSLHIPQHIFLEVFTQIPECDRRRLSPWPAKRVPIILMPMRRICYEITGSWIKPSQQNGPSLNLVICFGPPGGLVIFKIKRSYEGKTISSRSSYPAWHLKLR